jgi:RNA polymerase sigma-70 factor, ECF subfamily
MTAVEGPAAQLDDFEAVVRLYRPRIFRFALASTYDRDAAETLTQDCLVKAYGSREWFRGESSVQTWLMQIVVNLVRDRARNRRLQFWKRLQALPEPDAVRDWLPGRELSPEAKMLVKEQVAAVWRAAGRLPERQRTVFLLRFVEEMDLLEIAAATGMKEGTVKVHLFRALQAVRERIGRTK